MGEVGTRSRPRDRRGGVGVVRHHASLTAVALALAVAIVLVVVARRRTPARTSLAWRELGTLAAAALAALVFTGVWSWQSTGDPFTTPLSLYTQRYVPFDRLGFGVREGDKPSTTLPWDQRVTDLSFYEEHRIHTPSALPAAAVAARA